MSAGLSPKVASRLARLVSVQPASVAADRVASAMRFRAFKLVSVYKNDPIRKERAVPTHEATVGMLH